MAGHMRYYTIHGGPSVEEFRAGSTVAFCGENTCGNDIRFTVKLGEVEDQATDDGKRGFTAVRLDRNGPIEGEYNPITGGGRFAWEETE